MADPYFRVRISGGLPGGERWSVNPTYGGDWVSQLIDHQALQDSADDIALMNAGAVFTPALLSILSNAATITDVRLEWYRNGETLEDVAEASVSPVKSGTGGPALPITSAVCVSTLTGRVGRRYRGRLFFPCLSQVIGFPEGRISEDTAEYIAGGAATWLSQVALQLPEMGNPTWPVVMSAAAGETTRITRVRVGDVLDNIRSRKTALEEAYVTAAVS